MAAPADNSLQVSEANVAVYAEFHRELIAHLWELIEMTRKYPVEVEFKGLRFVFDSEADIRAAISEIDGLLKSYHRERR